MWKDYSTGYIRQNRSCGISVMAAAFISALFLSLLCSLYFNFWTYDIERIVLTEGDWQGRITGASDEIDLAVIEAFVNIEKAVVNERLSADGHQTVDLYFRDMRTIYQDLPLIAGRLGLDETAVSYHELLLSDYIIHDPQDQDPPLLLSFFVVVLLLVSFSLILIIHNSFAVSMNARIHQFGIFSSVGATPGQIRSCLIREAAMLCAIPLLLGSLLGIALSYGTILAVNRIAEEVAGRHKAAFGYHPLILVVTLLASGLTVLISAWLPARRLSKLTPLQAVQGTGEYSLKKKRQTPVLSLLFGIEGELAGIALKAQKKAFRTSTLSLTLSFLGFTLMLSFFTLSGISTEETYFERFQDAWDVMVTVKGTEIEDFSAAQKIRDLPGVENSIVYQKVPATGLITYSAVSAEVNGLGGLEVLAGSSVIAADGSYQVSAPVIVMDDYSFAEYCSQIGIAESSGGSIVLNQIWDHLHSNFRHPHYVPFISRETAVITLQSAGQEGNTVDLPVLAGTQQLPVLREEYENYSLVQYLSLTTWKQISAQIGGTGTDLYIRVLAEAGATLAELEALETEIAGLIGPDVTFEIENRIQEKLDNDNMIRGYQLIIGALCVLLAMIGIANVFSNTLGFLHQRRREYARYLSIGMAPEGIRKMFCIEALVIAGRPLFITLPLTMAGVGYLLRVSYVDPAEFLVKAPVVPVMAFILIMFGFVALAYYLGGRRILRCSLLDALKSDHIS